ncbi:MAG TPA: DUF4199 domain-containing protein [Salegentibacter sp.]|uniref:DUF4199 domain-containing protein n=1 Tax=Salegentibacter sp. TaxID=1903072 RepID=UPI002F9588FB
MEIQKTDSKGIIINYGVLLGILSVVLGVIMYVTNAYLNPSFYFSVASFLIMVAIIVLGIRTYKKANQTYLSLTEALKLGLGIALIGGIIGAIWQLLLMTVIEPDYMMQMADVQREVMLERFPNMTDSQIDDAMAMNEKFSSPWIMMAIAIIGSLFFGFFISLVAGLIMKNKNPYEA